MPTSARRQATPATARPLLRLAVQYAVDSGGLPARATLRRWLVRALTRDAVVTLRFVGAAEGRRLNRDFRSRDYATNVLTFAYDDGAKPRVNAALEGDIVLCVPVLEREARAAGRTLRAHCAHLVLHGALHLQGYDHEKDKDARVMEALETGLLRDLGYSDPYAA